MNYVLGPGWLLVPQLTYTKNHSNVELNTYDRTVASLSLRRTF